MTNLLFVSFATTCTLLIHALITKCVRGKSFWSFFKALTKVKHFKLIARALLGFSCNPLVAFTPGFNFWQSVWFFIWSDFNSGSAGFVTQLVLKRNWRNLFFVTWAKIIDQSGFSTRSKTDIKAEPKPLRWTGLVSKHYQPFFILIKQILKLKISRSCEMMQLIKHKYRKYSLVVSQNLKLTWLTNSIRELSP